MKNVSTHFLRLAIIGLGGLVLLFCIVVIPSIYSNWGHVFPELAFLRYVLVSAMLITAVAFYVALYHGMALLRLIDRHKAFSLESVHALRMIKYCGGLIGALYILAMPAVYLVAELDDAPGLILVGMAFAGAPITVSVFAALMQKLVQTAVELKTENDLTV